MDPRNRVILALDVDNAYHAIQLVGRLSGHVGAFKVGLELVNAAGVGIFEKLKDAGANRIFYDAKLHDIPNTVAGAARAIARHELWMVNVHASGGSRMVRAAADALKESAAAASVQPALLLGVTLLTSISPAELAEEMRIPLTVPDYVAAMARLAQESGCQGVVTSPLEIEVVREACGPGFLIVTPGVRPDWAAAGDQRRTLTPREAVDRGADFLVIGRPITAAADPCEAARRIVDELSA